jgi:hypothetical protein
MSHFLGSRIFFDGLQVCFFVIFSDEFLIFLQKIFGKGLTDLFSLTTFSPQYVGQIKKVDTGILMCDFLGKKLVVKAMIRRSLIGPN